MDKLCMCRDNYRQIDVDGMVTITVYYEFLQNNKTIYFHKGSVDGKIANVHFTFEI